MNCQAYVIRQGPKTRKAFITYQAECQSRHKIFEHFLADANRSGIDVDRIISEFSMFTPAEIGCLFQEVRQKTLEQECSQGEVFKVNTDMLLKVIPTIRQTANSEAIEAFQRDSAEFARY